MGLSRVIVGTAPCVTPSGLSKWPIGIRNDWYWGSMRDGMVATDGWLETSTTPAIDLARKVANLTRHVAAIVYTDIAKDGMLAGPNFEQLQVMQRSTDIPVVCSGGVTTLEDIRQLKEIGTHAAILGRALYEDRLDLSAVLALCPQDS